jgi:hypothetical protein
MDNYEDSGGEGARQSALRRLRQVSRWLSGEAPW